MDRIELPENDPNKDEYAVWDNAFLITINSNSADRGIARSLEELWKFITGNTLLFIYGREGAKLLEVKSHARIEIGKIMHRVHLHGTWVFRTEGIANIDLAKLRQFVNDNLRILHPGFARANINYKIIKGYNSYRLVEQYIEKDSI